MATRNFETSFHGIIATPCSLSSRWINILDAGGVAIQDAATITNPTTQIDSPTSHIAKRNNFHGTLVKVRLAYTGTPSADPVLVVFGRTGSDAWQKLYTKNGDGTVTLTTAVATDVTDGTYFYTEVTDDHTLDCDGCDEIIIGVQTAFNGTVTNTAVVQVKVI